jgi:hypothetical protein
MARPKSIVPRRGWQIQLPDDLSARILADLYSPVERCVPYGAFSRFIESCIRAHYRAIDSKTESV